MNNNQSKYIKFVIQGKNPIIKKRIKKNNINIIEMDIVFNCINCGEGIIKNSKEHDECICIDDDGKMWRCGDCKYTAPPDFEKAYSILMDYYDRHDSETRTEIDVRLRKEANA